MPTYDLTGTLEDGSVTFKVQSRKYPAGRDYRFASPTFEVGMWLKNLIEFGQRAVLGGEISDDDQKKLVLDDNEEADLYQRVMGDTLKKMSADGVAWAHVQDVFKLLLRHWGTGQDMDASIAEIAGKATAPPNRAARRASAKPSSPKAGSKSSRASSATKARTAGRASTRSSGTSAAPRAVKAS